MDITRAKIIRSLNVSVPMPIGNIICDMKYTVYYLQVIQYY